MNCVKCNLREVDFIAPNDYCYKCWADWWFDFMMKKAKNQKEKREIAKEKREWLKAERFYKKNN